MSSNINSKQFSNLLMFSLFEGRRRWMGILLIIAMPNIAKSINKIRNLILSYMYPKMVSVMLTQKKDKEERYISNFSYKSMCWYIISKYGEDQKSLICESDLIKRNEQMHHNVYKKIPSYFPNSSINVVHNTAEIVISFSRTSGANNICLKSCKMKPLIAFISHVNKLFEEYCYSNILSEKIYVFNWKHPRYSSDNGEFEPLEMQIFKTYDNIFLPDKLINNIKKDILYFKTGEDFYTEKGIPYKRGYLFYGPPGTGKTSTAYAIARENKMNLYKLDLKKVAPGNKFNVTTEQMVGIIPSNSVVLIEEVDTQVYNDRISTSITVEKDDKSGRLPMTQLMDLLDGYASFYGCIIILTTNNREYLNDTLIRPGRIDMHYLFDLIGSSDIKSTIKGFTGYDIDILPNITMTTSKLLNEILLPNRNDQSIIQTLVNLNETSK